MGNIYSVPLVAAAILIAVLVAHVLVRPERPPLGSFDVMLDQPPGALDLPVKGTRPCASDPTRACISLSIHGTPTAKP